MAGRRGHRTARATPYRGGARNTKSLQLVLATYGDVCHLCGRPGANSQDHLIPWSWTHDDSIGNLRPAHVPCNSKRGNRALPGYGGEVVIVMGPPAGGKTSYVLEHAQPHDVIIDYDRICRAIMPNPPEAEYAFPSQVRSTAGQMRRAGIERAMRLPQRCTAWVIHAVPEAKDLADYRFMRYRLVTVDPGYDVARERCARLRPPQHMQHLQRWYSAYGGLASSTDDTAARADAQPIGIQPSREW